MDVHQIFLAEILSARIFYVFKNNICISYLIIEQLTTLKKLYQHLPKGAN